MELFLEDPPLALHAAPRPAPVVEAAPFAEPAPMVSPGTVAIRAARAKLNAPPKVASVWPVVGAAAFAAVSALTLATAVIIGLPKF